MSFDTEHNTTIFKEKELLENQLQAHLYIENEILNKDISLVEVKGTVANTKKEKALKHLNCIRLFNNFFKIYFTNRLIFDE